MDENDIIMVFFSKVLFRIHLITAMFKFLTQQLEDTLTTAFETIHYRFYGHGSPYKLVFSWVNIFKQKSLKVLGKLSFTQSEPALRRKLHQEISLVIVCFFFSQGNLVYEFYIVLLC